MNKKYAYAQGAARRLSEAGVTPAQFIAAASRSGDHRAIKVAQILYEAGSTEKLAANSELANALSEQIAYLNKLKATKNLRDRVLNEGFGSETRNLRASALRHWDSTGDTGGNQAREALRQRLKDSYGYEGRIPASGDINPLAVYDSLDQSYGAMRAGIKAHHEATLASRGINPYSPLGRGMAKQKGEILASDPMYELVSKPQAPANIVATDYMNPIAAGVREDDLVRHIEDIKAKRDRLSNSGFGPETQRLKTELRRNYVELEDTGPAQEALRQRLKDSYGYEGPIADISGPGVADVHRSLGEELKYRQERLPNQPGATDALAGGMLGGMLAGSAGAAGLAYGMGDADTYNNKMRSTANEYLGTDFDTQSRLGYGAEQLRNRAQKVVNSYGGSDGIEKLRNDFSW